MPLNIFVYKVDDLSVHCKCLRFSLWLTLQFKSFYLLIYLLTWWNCWLFLWC